MDVALDRGWDGNGGKVVKVWGHRQQERKLATPLPLDFGLKRKFTLVTLFQSLDCIDIPKMPTIEELPPDAPVGEQSAAIPTKALKDRGGISEELAERLIRQKLEAGPEKGHDANSWLPGKSGKTFEEALKSFDDVPLFMKDLPTDSEASDEQKGQSAASLEALKSLAFDGSPDEVAANFKQHGNDYFKGKRFREAVDFYSKAIEAGPTGKELKLSLHLNRAACHLQLQNYRSSLKDASQALAIDQTSSKAFYRAAQALAALDKSVEAIDCCDHGLNIDDKNEEMRKLKEKIVKEAQLKEKRIAESNERERRKKETDMALKKAFLARGLWIEVSPRPPDNPSAPHFDPVSLPTVPLSTPTSWQPPDFIRTPVVFPVLFLYPQHNQTDFISDFHEDTTIGDHLEQMFPLEARGSLPWDPSGQYISRDLVSYVSTKRRRLLKVGKKLTLRQVLDQGARETEDSKGKVVERDGVVLKDGILNVVVLPKGKAETEWVDKFKEAREEAKRMGEI